MSNKIWLSPPHMGGSELKYVNEAFSSNWITPMGPNIDAFESAISSFVGLKHAAAMNSGTAAIHIALVLLGIKPGDEVIASTFTFAASVNPIVYLHATPVLVDSEAETWNMCPDTLEQAIKDRILKGKKPKAIIPVHLYGMPANIEKIISIANYYDIPVIEDAAEALGSRYQGKSVGSFGKISAFSFNGNKIITTAGGGMLLSDDEKLISKARYFSTQARDQAPHYEHSQLGYNYRMSNVLAGIGLGQMDVIKLRIQQRRDNFCFYKKMLSQYDEIGFLNEPDESYFSNRWLTTITLNENKIKKNREDLRKALAKESIESRPVWKPMHLQPIFKSCPKYLNRTSEELFKTGLCLPSGSNLTEEDRQRIADIIIDFIKT